MSAYQGWHAELYDLFYADKPYGEEAAFVGACLRENSQGPVQSVLELACGTGRHALALEQQGFKVVATDNSQDMLAVARRRAGVGGSAVEFAHADMRSLDVGPARFDAAVCLFDSIGYVASNEALEQVLRGVGRKLRPSGLFVFEFWHAAAMLRGYEPVRVRRLATPAGEIVRISETALDVASQTCRVTYSIYELHANGTYRSLSETQTNRFLSLPEMAALLEHAGFEPLKWFAGFRPVERIDSDTWHVVAVARKKS